MAEINESKFNMWRAVFSCVHLDGNISEQEKEWAKEKMNALPLSEEQKLQLYTDLSTQVNFDELLPNISHPADRAMLVHFCRTVCLVDGVYSDSEKSVLDDLQKKIVRDVNIESLEKEIQRMEEDSYKPKLETSNKNSVFASIIDWIKYGLDL